MQEIEVKAHIKNAEAVLGELARMGYKLSEPVEQKDTVYVPKGVKIPVPLGVTVLRVREQVGKIFLTLKIPQTNQLDCVERELTISDANEMEAIILALGFEKASYTEKSRRKGKVGELEVCVDTVRGLGQFIEVEKLVEAASGDVVQTELLSFLKSLGVSEEDQVFDGYDILLARKTGAIA